jgi:ubiquinone/menaquinone biosynthesis C-methylase UbiE
VASLPFPDRQFDKVLSIHSAYFWPDLERAMAEIGRVLAPGGLVVLALSPGKIGEPVDAGFQAMVERQAIPSLELAGFSGVTSVQGPDSRQYRTVAIFGERCHL